MFFGEEPASLGLDIDDADDFILDDEGNGELGAHLRVGIDVMLERRDIFNEHGFALECGLAHNPCAWLHAHPLHLGSMAGLEPHPEFVGSVVEQEDREDAVIDDRAHQVGDAVHERVEVKRRIQRIGKAMEEVQLQRLDVY